MVGGERCLKSQANEMDRLGRDLGFIYCARRLTLGTTHCTARHVYLQILGSWTTTCMGVSIL